MVPQPLAWRQRGITLAEMLVTVAVVAVAAAVVVPGSAPAGAFAADAAAGEVTRAIRFAQREALRTGAWHVARFDTATQTLQVYRLRSNGQQDTANPVMHPLDKAAYTVRFGDLPGTTARLQSATFKYKTRPVTNTLSFRPDGAPADLNPANQGVNLLEQDGAVVLALGALQRSVAVARVTGRASF